MIREATLADVPGLLEIAAEFHEENGWPAPVTFDPDSFAVTLERTIERGVVFMSERGLIGLTVNPSLYNHSVRVCAEMFFYAPDGQGDALRRVAEAWAAERASLLVMGGHEPGPIERISTWYGRKGYAPMARLFAKRVA